MTADTITRVGLPSQDDYEKATSALGKAEGKVERVEIALVPLVAAAKCGDGLEAFAPTLEDVGRLYSFLEFLEMDIGQLQTHRARIHDALGHVNYVRFAAEERDRAKDEG